MLELIFRGFLEWVYVLLVEIWGFIADGLLGIMSMDFAYLQTHVPIIPQMSQLLLAVGWALLMGNLVFQALKSMAAGLGFEGEDPKLLFSRTFVFAFLLMASPQICRIGLDLTSNIMDLLSVPNATDVGLVDEGIFGTLTAAWIMAIICSVIVMFKVLGLVIEVAERYVILAMLTITAPLAFAMGGSKNTASIFSGWCRMFGSMCLLMVTNLVCCKMLFSVVSTVPSGLDVLPWMVLIFAIVKVAKKSDAIITRIGLNPAITGGSAKTLPGMLAYTVARTAVNQVVRGMGGSKGGGSTSAKAPSPGAAKSAGFFNRFSGGGIGGGRYSSPSSGGAGGGYTYQNSRQQNISGQSATQQTNSQQSSTIHGGSQQSNTRQENASYSTAQQPVNGSTTVNSSSRNSQSGFRGAQGQQSRRSSVPPGTRRSPSYVSPVGAAAQSSGASNTQTPSGQSGAFVPKQPNNPRPGAAGTTVPKGGAFDAAKSHPGAAGTQSTGGPSRMSGTARAGTNGRSGAVGTQSRATQTNHIYPGPAGNPSKSMPPKQSKGAQPGQTGTGTHVQSTRSTHMASQAVSGGTVNNSTQTNVTAGRGMSGTATPRQPHPGGSAVSASPPKPDRVFRSTKRENTDAVPKTSAALAPGSSQPGSAEKAARSTHRPSESTPRPGRNTPPATAASPGGSASSNTARQERASSPSRASVSGTAPSPARQEIRKPTASTSPSIKGRAVQPGPAGTAPAGQRAAGARQPAAHSSKRAKPARRPPPRR